MFTPLQLWFTSIQLQALTLAMSPASQSASKVVRWSAMNTSHNRFHQTGQLQFRVTSTIQLLPGSSMKYCQAPLQQSHQHALLLDMQLNVSRSIHCGLKERKSKLSGLPHKTAPNKTSCRNLLKLPFRSQKSYAELFQTPVPE